ncbi:MAG: HAD family hydrolase [Cyanobacteria bacterium P01_F01_bin.42]
MICADRNSFSISGSSLPLSLETSACEVFCDLDGPLVDVSHRYYKTYCLAISETVEHYLREGKVLSVRPMHRDRFWHLKLERIPDVDIAQMTGFSGDEIDFFLRTVRDLVNQPHLLKEDRIQPWAIGALERLVARGIRLSLVTLRSHDQAVQVLKRFGLYHYFDVVQGSTDEFAAYDNYANVKTVMLSRLINHQADQLKGAWMIGDTEADIQSAKAVGVQSIAVSCGMRSQAYLQRLEPSYVVQNLEFAVDVVLNNFEKVLAQAT